MSPLPSSLVSAARSGELHGRTLAVFVELHEWLDTGDFRPVKAWRVADRLHMSRAHVYRALALLVRAGYLESGDPLGTATTFRLVANPSTRAA